MNYWYVYKTDSFKKYYTKWKKKTDTEDYILDDFIYMKSSEEANPQRQRVDWLMVA